MTIGPAPWDRGFWAHRCDRPLAFTGIATHGSCSFVLPPCATEPQLKRFADQFNAYLRRHAERDKRR